MTHDDAANAEHALFDDTLGCDVALPVLFVAGKAVARPGGAEMLLRSVALVEDSRGNDDGDERSDTSAQLQRLEARMDLALVLLGRLLQQSSAPLPTRMLRWSRHGLRLDLDQPTGLAPGTAGVVQLQPADWLPDHIELPATLLAEQPYAEGSRAWLHFAGLSENLNAALERHLFRVHRRQIADSRRNREFPLS